MPLPGNPRGANQGFIAKIEASSTAAAIIVPVACKARLVGLACSPR